MTLIGPVYITNVYQEKVYELNVMASNRECRAESESKGQFTHKKKKIQTPN